MATAASVAAPVSEKRITTFSTDVVALTFQDGPDPRPHRHRDGGR
nr:hypothetical protein [Mycolicibacterium sarraceniae]